MDKPVKDMTELELFLVDQKAESVLRGPVPLQGMLTTEYDQASACRRQVRAELTRRQGEAQCKPQPK